MKFVKVAVAALALYVLAGNPPARAQSSRSTDHWVGTWATAVVARPQAAPPCRLDDDERRHCQEVVEPGCPRVGNDNADRDEGERGDHGLRGTHGDDTRPCP